ncbi:MaoC family dehydratase [Rhodococcus opacus]|uniref:Enoyl-CoA hydratase n=1 Tax=Rhodococcus opacus TaxID=37919 RepID=A0A2S8IEG5_RHOOP|nr:MaoC family dehydratase [Rhodococcus opacus]PQP13141.1 enoyl-CoA hydratase [Rhodococcus opacus]
MNDDDRAHSVTMDELPALAGTRLGGSRAMRVTQERINLFAEATGDRQWIHVDAERARTGPFGATNAHGYLTLSLAVDILWSVFEVTDCDQVVNYGLNKVRFPAPVPVASMLSVAVDVTAVEPCSGGFQTTMSLTLEILGGSRPYAWRKMLLRFYGRTGQ